MLFFVVSMPYHPTSLLEGKLCNILSCPPLIVHLTKLLNADWSRAVQSCINCTPV